MNYKDPEYHRAKSKEHYQRYKEKYNDRNAEQRKTKRSFLDEAKKDGCVVCGEKEAIALDFHHLFGKDFNLSRHITTNVEKLMEEVAKCVVLCANCHRKVHHGSLRNIAFNAQGVQPNC